MHSLHSERRFTAHALSVVVCADVRIVIPITHLQLCKIFAFFNPPTVCGCCPSLFLTPVLSADRLTVQRIGSVIIIFYFIRTQFMPTQRVCNIDRQVPTYFIVLKKFLLLKCVLIICNIGRLQVYALILGHRYRYLIIYQWVLICDY